MAEDHQNILETEYCIETDTPKNRFLWLVYLS